MLGVSVRQIGFTHGPTRKKYDKGEVIFRQGDTGNCKYVIQTGGIEAPAESGGEELRLLTIDKKNLLGGIHEDSSLAFRIVETMSHRIRDLTDRLAKYEESG